MSIFSTIFNSTKLIWFKIHLTRPFSSLVARKGLKIRIRADTVVVHLYKFYVTLQSAAHTNNVDLFGWKIFKKKSWKDVVVKLLALLNWLCNIPPWHYTLQCLHNSKHICSLNWMRMRFYRSSVCRCHRFLCFFYRMLLRERVRWESTICRKIRKHELM